MIIAFSAGLSGVVRSQLQSDAGLCTGAAILDGNRRLNQLDSARPRPARSLGLFLTLFWLQRKKLVLIGNRNM